MKKITCRLSDALWERHMTLETLSEETGISKSRLQHYLDSDLESVDLGELTAILGTLGCHQVSDLLVITSDSQTPAEPDFDSDQWYAPCPAAPGQHHDWHKDMEVSTSVYQEYECRTCGKRIYLIW